MNKTKLLQNPLLLFSPFLIIFICYVLYASPENLVWGDSVRYLSYAQNLLDGFYSPPAPNIQLRNGPGYPIILMLFLLLKLPLITIVLANALFHYLSIVFLYKALKEIVTIKLATVFSLGWGCYYLAYQNMSEILTEPFTFLLITLFIYSVIKAFHSENTGVAKKYIIIAGITFGFIVLTKMLFGYVLMFILIGIALVWLTNRKKIIYQKGMYITLIALLTTAPYLIYTYQLTGRIFFWGTGSDTLYWMSTPYEEEYGDFNYGLDVNPIEEGNFNIKGSDSILIAHHWEDFKAIDKLTGLEWDDEYKRIALKNIKEHPAKYAQNVIYNMGRLIFHYPYSQAIQRPKTLLVFPINGILLALMLFCMIPTIINWRRIPFVIKYLLVFTVLYLGGSSLITGILRMFTIIVPVLLFWIAYTVHNTVKINFKIDKETNTEE